MLTRGSVAHSYTPSTWQFFSTNNGAIRSTMYKGIPQTWAITRPNSATSIQQMGVIDRGGPLDLNLTQPNLAMDPLDRRTWQRPYEFSNGGMNYAGQ